MPAPKTPPIKTNKMECPHCHKDVPKMKFCGKCGKDMSAPPSTSLSDNPPKSDPPKSDPPKKDPPKKDQPKNDPPKNEPKEGEEKCPKCGHVQRRGMKFCTNKACRTKLRDKLEMEGKKGD